MRSVGRAALVRHARSPEARSEQTDVVGSNAAPLTNTARPTITGEARVGQQLIASEGTWTGNPSIDGAIGSGGIFSRTLNDGTHTITASATDSAGQTRTASVTITVGAPPEATTVRIASVTYATEGGRQQNQHLLVTVAVVDDQGKPVGGAALDVRLDQDGVLYLTASGTTGTDGKITFKARNAPSGCYVTTVTSVTASGLSWDGITPANEFCK